jgi:tetratricopeptide (TPR) repeat protein
MTNSIDLATAEAYMRASRFDEADAACRAVLQVEPRNARALGLLGEIARRTSRHEAAIDSLEKAIALEGGSASLHHELGAALQAAGKLERSELALLRSIELDPGHISSYVVLAAVQLGLGKLYAAEVTSRTALAREPKLLDAYVNLGSALLGQGKIEQAAEAHRTALAIDPSCVPVLCNHVSACVQLGRSDEAEQCASRAVRLQPSFFEAQSNLGHVLIEKMELERAIEAFRKAVALRPTAPMGHVNLGYAYAVIGELAAALKCYESALAQDPDCVPAHLYRGRLLLLQESYPEAWRELEWRQRAPGQEPLHRLYARIPRWNGTPLAGRTILVYGEQGLGDEIMFASCLPQVIAEAGRCVIDCEPRLASLFRRSFPQAAVHTRDLAGIEQWLGQLGADCALPSGSLPLHFRRRAADFPRRQGYLQAAPERIAQWRSRLEQLGSGLKVGLSWRGGIVETGRSRRSLDLEQLLPVLHQPGVNFISLQYGDCTGELNEAIPRHGLRIRHWQAAIDDYEETAALVCALDLTISVCTAVVHLAGALGRPVWVMAPLFPEARYGLTGESMPWYPSVRMFRQRAPGAWDDVIVAVARELQALRAAG